LTGEEGEGLESRFAGLAWWKDFVARLRVTMDRIPGLSAYDREGVEELLGGGEWPMAVELLCIQLYEYATPIPPQALAELIQAAADTDIESRAQKLLENPVLRDNQQSARRPTDDSAQG
jgi:hypothetical protein